MDKNWREWHHSLDEGEAGANLLAAALAEVGYDVTPVLYRGRWEHPSLTGTPSHVPTRQAH